MRAGSLVNRANRGTLERQIAGEDDGRMKTLTGLCLAAALAAAVSACDMVDPVDFDPTVASPAFPEGGPTVLFDAGHHNHHRLDQSFRPFAGLLRNDGFRLATLDEPVSAEALSRADILVVVTAQSDTETNAEPAFAASEIAELVRWIRSGGSLLLVSEHYPFANAVEDLANALGFDVAKGMTFDPVNHRRESGDDSRLLFTRENGLLASHQITEGRSAAERVRVVETFTGDALRPRAPGIAPLLRLGPTAINRAGTPRVTRRGGDVVVNVEFGPPTSAQGWLQGAALELGDGRVVVLAEAAMLTAQEDGGRPLGMNAPGNDDRQFLLNVMRWLGRASEPAGA